MNKVLVGKLYSPSWPTFFHSDYIFLGGGLGEKADGNYGGGRHGRVKASNVTIFLKILDDGFLRLHQ